MLIAAISVPLLTVLAWHIALGPDQGAYFDSAGLRLYYTDEGQGTPLVLVHGFAGNAHLEWRRLGITDALAKRYRVISIDNRGHGRSDKPHAPEQYGARMPEDIMRLLDHLHIEKAHVVGYSMGGFITLKLVTMHPERIISAAVCGAGWEELTPENLAFGEAVARSIESGAGDGPLGQRLGIIQGPPRWWEKLAFRAVLGYFNDPRAMAAVMRGFQGLAVSEAELRANTIPVLTIVGGIDGLLPSAKALAERMANHKLVVLDGKDHMTTTPSKAFIEELMAFLAEHEQRS